MSDSDNKEQNYPVGKSAKLADYVGRSPSEHLVPTSFVKNRVLQLNEHFPHLPFNLETGKPCKLAVFASSGDSDGPRLEVWGSHGRSAVLSRLIFADDAGMLFRDVDLKGIGYLKFGKKVEILKPGLLQGTGSEMHTGLVNKDESIAEYKNSEKLIENGVRTSRLVAIIGLEELIAGRDKLSLREAVSRQLILGGFQPVIEVRAFGTKARVEDLDSDKKINAVFLEDAKSLVRQETKQDKIFTDRDYIFWFTETLGKNLAILHKMGFVHGNLSTQNVTLDCRIVDLPTLRNANDVYSTNDDVTSGLQVINSLLTCIRQIRSQQNVKIPYTPERDLMHLFRDSYSSVSKWPSLWPPSSEGNV